MKPTTAGLVVAVFTCSRVFAGPPGTAYSIGNPTAKEQLYVELMNRARADPTAEGVRLAGYNGTQPDIAAAYSSYAVNLTAMQAEFVTGSSAGKPILNVAQPLSINAALTTAARLHSQDQITWDFQGHVSHNGNDSGQRLAAQGYSASAAAENVYTQSASVLYGHAGFNVDWGNSTDGTGMQGTTSRDHRANIHGTAYREVGVGNLTSAETTIPSGNTSAKGPEIVTQDFATATGSTPFITGVVYYDFNGNSFYDPGEGIGGVEVGASGSSYKGVTAASGGYSIPVSGNGTYPLTFWFPGAGSANATASATVSGLLNVKADWKPAYVAPVLAGPAGPVVGVASTYTSSAVGGAATYVLRSGKAISSPAAEGADSGSGGYTLTPGAAGTLAVETGGASGNCFHFGHNNYSAPELLLTRLFVPGASGVISFQSKLRYAFSSEIARLQVRESGGAWVNLWSQAGSNGAGESSFNLRSASLAAYANKMIDVRFIYECASGYYYSSGSLSGWFMDSIAFTGTEEITGVTTTSASGPALAFTPASTGNYRLWVKPRLADTLYQLPPWSAALNVTAYASGYASWVATQYPAVTGGLAADHDGDGLRNMVEYAFGLNPTVPTGSGSLPQAARVGSTLVFSYATPVGVSGVVYGAEWSTNLTSWNTITDTGSGGNHVFSVSTTGKSKVFMRHRVVVTP